MGEAFEESGAGYTAPITVTHGKRENDGIYIKGLSETVGYPADRHPKRGNQEIRDDSRGHCHDTGGDPGGSGETAGGENPGIFLHPRNSQ